MFRSTPSRRDDVASVPYRCFEHPSVVLLLDGVRRALDVRITALAGLALRVLRPIFAALSAAIARTAVARACCGLSQWYRRLLASRARAGWQHHRRLLAVVCSAFGGDFRARFASWRR